MKKTHGLDLRGTFPLSMEEQLRIGDREGERDWFNINRETLPLKRRPKAAGCIPLDVKLMKEKRIESIADWTPENARELVGGPRNIGRYRPKLLKRFNGTPVEPAVFTQIYDGESRTVFSTTESPWCRVGQVSSSLTGNGTGALVGRSTVLTAAHVVANSWSPGGPVKGTVTFTPAMFDGVSALGAGWTANVIGIAAWEQFVGVDGYDMAILQLDQPMGDWLGRFGARAYNDAWEDGHYWTHVGYPYDLSVSGSRPCYEIGISVHDDDSDSFDTLELETRADIASGQSGGPLWGRWEKGGNQIIGTLSGRENNFLESKNSLFAGGNGLVNLVNWGRANWG